MKSTGIQYVFEILETGRECKVALMGETSSELKTDTRTWNIKLSHAK